MQTSKALKIAFYPLESLLNINTICASSGFNALKNSLLNAVPPVATQFFISIFQAAQASKYPSTTKTF